MIIVRKLLFDICKAMLSIKFPLLVVILSVLGTAQAKKFNRCELAKALLNDYQFPRANLANWVCLINAQSKRNTALVGPVGSDGSRDYGLFQINSVYWCSGGPKSEFNECNVACTELTNEDISDDVNCAKKIFERHGFEAWNGWKKACKNKNIDSVLKNCKL